MELKFHIIKDNEEYVGLCDAFPSLSWVAKTKEEAMNGIMQVVKEIIEDGEIIKELKERGYTDPEKVLERLDKAMSETESIDLGSFAKYI